MEVQEQNIIQIVNEEHEWFPALLIVDKVKEKIVLAYAVIPNNEGTVNGAAYMRIDHKDYKVVGIAAFTM